MLDIYFDGVDLAVVRRWNKLKCVLAADELSYFAISTIKIFRVLGKVCMAAGRIRKFTQQCIGLDYALL